MTKRKRGRPAGSVSKRTQEVVDSFSETLDEWDRMEEEANKVNYEELCQKLQEALAKSYCDYECLEKHVATFRDGITRRDIIIQYLESRIR
jgi:hypothetical protein